MNLFTGSGIYLVIWFLTFFMVLPFGVRTADEPEPGHATSAPVNPRIGLKILITTGIAAVVWLVIYWMVSINIMSIRPPDA